MRAEEAIAKAYSTLLDRATKKDVPLYDGKTSEDLLGECCLTMLRRYRGEVDEFEIFTAFERIFLEKCFFAYKKKTSKKNRLVEYVPDYGDGI